MNQSSPQQLKSLQEKILGASQKLDNLNTEVNVVGRRRQQIASETKKETDRLLRKRRTDLNKLEKQVESRLKPLETTEKQLKDSLRSLTASKTALEADLVALRGEIKATRDVLSDQQQLLNDKKAELQVLETTKLGLEKSINSLNDQKNSLQTSNSELINQNAEVKRTNEELTENLDFLRRDFKVAKQAKEEQIAALNERLETLISQAENQEQSNRLVREDLAKRQRAIAEKEKNLSVREYKVRRDEGILARNADLLDL